MSAVLISESTYTANKKHVCDLCGQHIQVGDKYIRQFCIDGHAYAFKMHLVCEDISKHYSSEYDFDDEGYDSNCFSNDVIENFKEVTGVDRKGMPYKEAVELFKEHWQLRSNIPTTHDKGKD